MRKQGSNEQLPMRNISVTSLIANSSRSSENRSQRAANQQFVHMHSIVANKSGTDRRHGEVNQRCFFFFFLECLPSSQTNYVVLHFWQQKKNKKLWREQHEAVQKNQLKQVHKPSLNTLHFLNVNINVTLVNLNTTLLILINISKIPHTKLF